MYRNSDKNTITNKLGPSISLINKNTILENKIEVTAKIINTTFFEIVCI